MIATEPVFAWKLVTMSGKRNSFQLKMNARMNAASSPGPAKGNTIRATMDGSDAPSIAALSANSRGISSRYVRMIQMASGIWNPVKRMMSAARVSINPKVFMASWIGMRVVTGGNMRGSSMSRKSKALPLKSRKLNVTAARLARPTANSAPTVDVSRLFQMGSPKSLTTTSRNRANVDQKMKAERSTMMRSGFTESSTRERKAGSVQ